MDASISLANKLSEIIKENIKSPQPGAPPRAHQIDQKPLTKLFKYAAKTKNPRLYTGLVNTTISYLKQNMNLKETDVKSLCWLFNSIVALEKPMYTRFDII